MKITKNFLLQNFGALRQIRSYISRCKGPSQRYFGENGYYRGINPAYIPYDQYSLVISSFLQAQYRNPLQSLIGTPNHHKLRLPLVQVLFHRQNYCIIRVLSQFQFTRIHYLHKLVCYSIHHHSSKYICNILDGFALIFTEFSLDKCLGFTPPPQTRYRTARNFQG